MDPLGYFNSLDLTNLTYTPFYCEENVWKLCEKVSIEQPQLIGNSYAVFISNDIEQVPLWCQKNGRPDKDHLVVWDYHVIFVYSDGSHFSIVCDFDTLLPFVSPFGNYVQRVLRPECNRFYQFRVVAATHYLQCFASDRSRMRDKHGQFLKPPPDYPCIRSLISTNNLDCFISMDKNRLDLGYILDLEQFNQMFHKN